MAISLLLISVLSISSIFVAANDDQSYLFTIGADDSCTSCYEIEGSTSLLDNPWLSESGLIIKKESLAKRGPIGVLHPGLDLKKVLKKEPKSISRPEGKMGPGGGGHNSTEEANLISVLITKKKPHPKEGAGAGHANETVAMEMELSVQLEYYLVGAKPGSHDIFKEPPHSHKKGEKIGDERPPLLVKKMKGPCKPRPGHKDCEEGGGGGGGEFNLTGNATTMLSEIELYYDSVMPSIGMYGAENSWWRSDGAGTFFEISDVYNQDVFYSGTLCPGSESGDACGMELQEGFYVYHVYGAEDPNKDSIAWNFCSTHGGAESDLLIYVSSSGECSPMSISVTPSSLSDSRHYFVLNGVIELSGYFTQHIDNDDKQILMSSLLYESRQLMTSASYNSFHDWVRSVVVYQSNVNAQGGEQEVLGQISFFMAVTAEDFGVFDMDQSKQMFMLEVLSAALESSMESNDFVNNILNVDQYSSYTVTDNLAQVMSARLVSLSVLTSEEKELSQKASANFGKLYSQMSVSVDAEVEELEKVFGGAMQSGLLVGAVIAVALVAGVAWFVNRGSSYSVVHGQDEELKIIPCTVPRSNLHESI